MISALIAPGMSIMQTPASDWMVQVPLSQLVELQAMSVEMAKLRDENKRLLNRVDGLHRTLFDTLEKLGELQRKGRIECQ